MTKGPRDVVRRLRLNSLHPTFAKIAESPALLSKTEELAKLLDQLNVLPQSTYLRPFLIRLLTIAFGQSSKAITRFIRAGLSLNEVCGFLIEALNASGLKASVELGLKDLEPIDHEVHRQTIDRIKQSKWSPEINIFSYGIGSGWYEQELKKTLLDDGICKSVRIFGYDPNADIGSDSITLVKKENLKELPPFDLFLSRWVLHHVPRKQRWHEVASYLEHVRPGGRIFFVEEGVFADESEMSLDQKIYTLIFAALDLSINYVVLGNWIAKENFFIQHLSEQDIALIETSMGCQTQEYIDLNVPMLRSVLLSYEK